MNYSGTNMNSGYHGYSMSNRAFKTYENGEMPISKWSKATIIDAIREIDNEKAELFKEVKLDVLKKKVLVHTSWHHTSKYANKTDFYSLNKELIKSITVNQIKQMKGIELPKPKVKERTFRGDIYYCTYDYSSGRRSRNYNSMKDVDITERGEYYIVKDVEGNEILKKKKNSSGIKVVDYALEEKRKLQRAEQIRNERIKRKQRKEEKKRKKEIRKQNRLLNKTAKTDMTDANKDFDCSDRTADAV